jgi:osmotically-inducible protein OsmY
MSRSFLLSMAVCAVLSSPARARAESPSDAQVRSEVEKRLAERDLDAVQVEVKNHAVLLSGSVPNSWQETRAIAVVQDVDGVDAVVSDVDVQATTVDDVTLAHDVAGRLAAYPSYETFDAVTVSVQDGVVTLDGRVTQAYKAAALMERASTVPGVRRVVDQIRVPTVAPSRSDAGLRQSIAAALYADPAFARYAAGSYRPVHVVVDDGRVRLVGVVPSLRERQRAEAIALSVPGATAVFNELTIER